jgi:hypothetical protein
VRPLTVLIIGLIALTTATFAQEVGRPRDGFYSGQTGAQSNGQVSGRVDGRANRNEGVPPATGDANKKIQVIPDRPPPTNAESMDSIVRPGIQK